MSMHDRIQRRDARTRRVRARIFGTADCPRARVSRSLRGIRVQIIDDVRGHTLFAASSLSFLGKGGGTKTERAVRAGKDLAQRALAAGISRIVFDRGGLRYHGQVAAVAQALRDGGLSF